MGPERGPLLLNRSGQAQGRNQKPDRGVRLSEIEGYRPVQGMKSIRTVAVTVTVPLSMGVAALARGAAVRVTVAYPSEIL